jgi:hypothetical protein
MDAFDKIANRFDTTFERKIGDAVAIVQTEKQQLVAEVNNALSVPTVEIKDREYLETKIKGLIDRTVRILDMMDNDLNSSTNGEGTGIPPQAKAFIYKTYADVTNAISIQIRELRELSKMTMGLDMVNTESIIKANEGKHLEEKAKQKKFMLSTSDLTELVHGILNEKTEMSEIKAEFKIID